MNFEVRVGLEDDKEEELSEYEDHISISSESDNEFEEEDETDHQLASKEPVSSWSQDNPANGQKQQNLCLEPRWIDRHSIHAS